MLDVKEIKSIEIAPFTLMSSSIHAILAFIAAIIMLIIFGSIAAFMPQLGMFSRVITLAGAALIIIYPISTFFIYLAVSFFSILLYNALVPRVGGVKLGLDGSEVAQLPVVPFAWILAIIEAIWAFIIGLSLAAAIAPFTALINTATPVITKVIANVTNTPMTTIPSSAVGVGGVVTAVFLIIALPILVLIFGFIFNALFAIFYNYIATRAAKIRLEFTGIKGTLNELTYIPVVPAALSIAVVFAVFGFLAGLGRLITLSANGDVAAGIGAFIASIIQYFVQYFIITALAAIFYNYLAPRIGAVKLELE